MFPLSALVSHAELTKKKSNKQAVEARRALRCKRHGNLTLYPRVEYAEAVDQPWQPTDRPRVIASISNVSTSGVGLILDDELPAGLEFDVQWPQPRFPVPLRFEVVHSQPMAGGMYRTGARLVAGIMPPEPMPSNLLNQEQPDEPEMIDAMPIAPVATEVIATEADQAMSMETSAEESLSSESMAIGGILRYEPEIPLPETDRLNPPPPGTLRIASAFGVDKTETLDGVTTCGWERSISLRRDGSRLWVYIHSPGKKNGWGIFVDPEEFDAAHDRVQQSAVSPFITTLAA